MDAAIAGPSTAAPPHPAAPLSDTRADDADTDTDTCRICRGEGTPEEPLFYPCKCSGSIKYVHQECLMEWLSHSQKKYCELCKTSFRFTKLYHPRMPKSIPTAIFVRRAAIHVVKLFMTWCRAVLVAAVWLILLPWCMRVVWRSLFWVGDGGWIQNDNRTIQPSAHTQAIHEDPSFWNIYVERFFPGAPQPPLPTTSVNETTTNATVTVDFLGPRSPSLLSDIPLLHWFKSQAANRFLLDVLEGQIITLLVVVAFILIFLIREWVVQQQPVINMVALGDNAAAQQLQEQDNDNDVGVEVGADLDDQDDEEDEEEEEELAAEEEEEQAVVDLPDEHVPAVTEESLPTAPTSFPERSSSLQYQTEPEQVNEEPNHLEPLITIDPGGATGDDNQEDVSESSSSWQRPHMPARDQFSVATEIQRGLEENNPWSFADVPRPLENAANHESVPDSWQDEEAERAVIGISPDQSAVDQDLNSDNSSESWQQVPETVTDNVEDEPHKDKGKDKIKDEESEVPDQREEKLDQRTTTTNEGKKRSAPTLVSSSSGFGQSSLPNNMLSMPSATLSEQHGTQASILPAAESEGTPTDASTCGSDSYRDAHGTDNEDGTEDSEAVQTVTEPSTERTEEIQVDDPQPVRGLRERILDWVFRDVGPGAQNLDNVADDELVVQALADFEQFDQIAARGNDQAPNVPIQDPEVAVAAAQAGIDVNDQDAIDDAEDLEGIMELIGMQGPLTGLFQNAMFSAVLISATLTCAVWFPYIWGKVVILFMGSPVALFVKLPLQIIATLADLFVDGALCLSAGGVYWTLQAVRMVIKVGTLGMLNPFTEHPISLVTGSAYNIATSAAGRLSKLAVESPLLPPLSDLRLSMNSHVALRTIQNTTSHTFNQTSAMVTNLCEEFPMESASKLVLQALRQLPASVTLVYNKVASLLSWLLTTKSYKITFESLDLSPNVGYAYAALEQWTATDRLIAVLAGYSSFAVAGAIYLRRGSPVTSSQQGQKIERIIAEILQQAGGVLKVILIISIEMLVFPLYCGLLLDMALLPLFKDATFYTRWHFTRENPWTSGFVHWFIGTCYMFHFALFVSMCRKILRKGVLYFIRDPDDPTFHPVRDVLERSVTTQLRKIAFSGLVYGGLVIVCLGGVVWTLSQATDGVLPILWVSHAPSLEFPLDLLFYNFLTPVVIKVYKPSDGMHVVSRWWFKLCARGLRMSNFLFGDKNFDEEGRKVNGEMVFDGRYVRAPASDQVRIPKGDPVFIEVYEDNIRKDGNDEGPGVHNSDTLVTKVYIPPWFRVRIALFVITIWIFAAVAGISVTIIPLIFGRYLFSLFLPKHVEMNDIHAFSLGLYTLGSVAYTTYQAFKFLRSLRPIPSPLTTLYNVATTTARISLLVARFAYVWTSLIAIVPLLFAIIIELYLLMPLHAYFGPKEPHVVHIIQDWTLGFLYARLAARVIFSNRTSRPARAFSAVIAEGYLYPNAQIATRAFLLPAVALFVVAMTVPAAFALLALRTVLLPASDVVKALVWRFCYPALGLAGAAVWAAREGVSVVGRWRMVVRDEVYLIGERLHNFGERRGMGARVLGN